ncbi:MAG: hypothetical protein J6U14_08140 [Bacteroidaceae bacterium]|nr:hypothetical protein [Bacteroidaceae bacterium]
MSVFDELIEITYSVDGFAAVGETTFTKCVSESIYNKLRNIEDEGETLDSLYLSEHKKGLHKYIIRAIRENMLEEGLSPDDGMIEKGTILFGKYSEFHPEASYKYMHDMAMEDEIEYTIFLL